MINRKGFSLIELMIVIAIIGILVAVLLPQLASMSEDAQKSQAEQSLKAIRDAVVRYNANNSSEPCSDLNWLVPRYVAELKLDPWGHSYCIEPEAGLVFSPGPDGISGDETDLMSRDDNITAWFKPQLMIEDAVYSDNNNNGAFDDGDSITIAFTKSARAIDGGGAATDPDSTYFTIYNDGTKDPGTNPGIQMDLADFFVIDQNACGGIPGSTTDFSRSKYKVTLEIQNAAYTPTSPWQPFTADFKQLFVNCTDNNLFEDAARYRGIVTPRHVPVRRGIKK